MKRWQVGKTSTYINDFGFEHLTDIPVEVAVEWVKRVVPEVQMGSTIHCKAKELTLDGEIDTDARGNGWFNKLFVIVAADYRRCVALYNHDDKFSVWVKEDK